MAKDQPRIQEERITLSDGVRLAADWYLPEGISEKKRPVILEYLPYRKEEGRRNRFGLFSYFVDHDYLVIRVDIRGTGNSEGKLIAYEYTDQEQRDALEVIDWLSRHPFSNGQVVMMGISWGGFNALQVAMRKPQSLKAIITLMSTDDLYQDDVHYMDGVMHVDAYEIGQDLSNCLPGAPDFVVDSAYFADRFDTKPWLLTYILQQRDGPFWNRASLNEDYQAIDVPVFAIGGLYDGYRDFIPRYFSLADVPVKAIIGPWNHTFPNWADPEPAIEWRSLAVDWMNCWLHNNCTDTLDQQSTLTIFQRDWHAPGLDLKTIDGYWRQDSEWPSNLVQDQEFYLTPEYVLSEKTTFQSAQHHLRCKPSLGVEASGSVMWWGDWAPDQSIVDQQSLVYETDVLTEDLEISGFPTVTLNTSVDTTLAHWVVRLSDQAPDGRVTQVTGAAFNGAHVTSAETPKLIDANLPIELPIEMHFTTWTFRKGHRIRLAINNAQWPMLWPTPYPLTMTIHFDGATKNTLRLPVIPHSPARNLTFSLPNQDPKLPGYRTIFSETNSGFAEITQSCYDFRTQNADIVATNSSEEQYPWGRMTNTEEIRHTTNDNRPAETGLNSIYTTSAILPGRNLRWEGHLKFTSDPQNFHYQYTRKLFDNEQLIREKSWNEIIPRDHH